MQYRRIRAADVGGGDHRLSTIIWEIYGVQNEKN
jgi:hypothetical protein